MQPSKAQIGKKKDQTEGKSSILENQDQQQNYEKGVSLQDKDQNFEDDQIGQQQEENEDEIQKQKQCYNNQDGSSTMNQISKEKQAIKQKQIKDNEQNSIKHQILQQSKIQQLNNLVYNFINNNNTQNHQYENNHNKKSQIKALIERLKQQQKSIATTIDKNADSKEIEEENAKVNKLQTKIQVLQIKLRLQQKMQKQKQLTPLERINHLDHIFKHYCTHIFKTGKHMTFDRLQYEKVHLTIDRFFVFLKDFNLTSIKTKDGKLRQIIDKQQIIKLFKKISPNCRDLNFQQFILMIEKLGKIYFDSKFNYEERKINERKERLKIKQNIEKKEKFKQQMLRRHKQKMENLKRGIQKNDQEDKLQEQKGGQNDDFIKQMMKEGVEKDDTNENNQDQNNFQQEKIKTTKVSDLSNSKIKKSRSIFTRALKKQPNLQKQNKQWDPLISLSSQEKKQYFYEIINVDNIQSFTEKLRQLNLPLFKIYANQGGKNKDLSQSRRNQRSDNKLNVEDKVQETEEERRLKQLRQKLNERNQKLKHSSVPSISRQQYEQRKLKRSRLEQEEALGLYEKKKSKKIDISETQINLYSLSKLNYDNLKFDKFDPKKLFSREEEDRIYLKEYDDSPVVRRKANKNFTELSKLSNTNRLIEQKDKNSSSFLQKLKQRQSQVEINQKKQQVSQLYRMNDRTERQKKLIGKFLGKNK